jgi:hypothetical protein
MARKLMLTLTGLGAAGVATLYVLTIALLHHLPEQI